MAVRRRMSLEQLQEALRGITGEVKNELRDAMTRASLLVERDAKINAPVDTGTLRNSISHVITENGDLLGAEVGASVEYAKYQEYGTSRMPAHPFLAPAFFNNQEKIKSLISKAVENALKSR